MTETPTITVHEAWSNVMNQALALGKTERFDGGERGAKFNYRGIDALMNLVGPILRANQVSIIPSVTSAHYRDVMTAGGKSTREVTVMVDYAIIGPGGDVIHGTSAGESLDTSDKGTAKACSVAFRVFLLQSLCLPTDEPDPDSEVYQRVAAPTPTEQAQKVADGLPSSVSYGQVDGVKRWSGDRNLLDIVVNDADGNSKPLSVLIEAKLEEHAAKEPAVQQTRQDNVDKALGGGDGA